MSDSGLPLARFWISLPRFLRRRLALAAVLLGKPNNAVIQEAMEFYLAALPLLYERRLREAVLAYMWEEFEKEGRRSASEHFETLMGQIHLPEVFLISLNQRRWGKNKFDYSHPIELFFNPEIRDRSQAFWAVFDADEEKATMALAVCRDLTRRDAQNLLEEERNEILDLVTVLDRLRLAYDCADLFRVEGRERLVGLAAEENEREAVRIRLLRKSR